MSMQMGWRIVAGCFRVGGFYVTTFVYRDFRLRVQRHREAGFSPIVVGPMYLHTRKDKADHAQALALMAVRDPRLRGAVRAGLQAYVLYAALARLG